MKSKFFLLLLLTAYLKVTAQTYITNANVLDVKSQKILTNYTIVIKGNIIEQVAPANEITPPTNTHIIDATGKWIIPGLVDAHIHFFQSGGLYTRPDAIDLRKYYSYEKEIEWAKNNMEDILRRYLSCGITTVIDVGATLNLMKQRDTFATKSYAPKVFMTGPLISTYLPKEFNLPSDEPFYEVHSAEDGKKMVQKQLPSHPDFIKIWYIITDRKNVEADARKNLPIIKAIIEEAHLNNLKVAVHATQRITAQLAVEAGTDFLVHDISDEIIDNKFIQLLKDKKTVLCPTLVVASNYNRVFGQTYVPSAQDFAIANPTQLGSLNDLAHIPDFNLVKQYKEWIKDRARYYQRADSISYINLKKLIDAGIPIATGTDAGNIGTMHASSYYDELKAMQQAGLTNWQIISASTINGAKSLGKQNEFGSIVKGKTADLLILNSNPVDDLANLQKIDLVINKGTIIKPDTLIHQTPLALVQRQLNAYNAHNLDAFMETYADNVELYKFPNQLTCKGKEEMRKKYLFLEKSPGLHCEVRNRTILNNIIIDHERVTGLRTATVEAIAIYFIENNKISKVYFLP